MSVVCVGVAVDVITEVIPELKVGVVTPAAGVMPEVVVGVELTEFEVVVVSVGVWVVGDALVPGVVN